jgi:hypothetical protein
VWTQLLHDVAEALRPHRIESVCRFVEHDDAFVMQQCLREAESLEVSLGKLAHPLRAMLVESEPLDGARDARPHLVGRHAGEQRIPVQRLVHAPRRWNVHQFGQVADAVLLDELPRGPAVNAHGAGGRTEEAEHERDERALAGTVGAGEAEHLTGLDLERQVVEGENFAPGPAPVTLPDVIELDQRGACGWVAFGGAPYCVIPGGIVPTGTVPGAGAHAVHGPVPARWIQRTPSSSRPSRTSEQPR